MNHLDIQTYSENIYEVFTDDIKNKIRSFGFYIENIKSNDNGLIVCEINDNKRSVNYGLLLSDAQKEVFGIDKKYDVIFINGEIDSLQIKEVNHNNGDIIAQSILIHELEELKYWSKVEDRLAFVPRPETIAFFQKQNYDIMQVLKQDEEILTREFVRQELIHLRADYNNLGNKKIDRGLVVAIFDKLDLEEELKEKLKRAYIKAIKILNLLYLLDKKHYFDKEYNIGLAKQNTSGLIKFIIEKSPKKILSYLSKLDLNIISQILEEDFLEILNNPEEKIKEIGLKNATNYKIEKLKIDTGEGWKNWTYPEINIDGYFSQKIWVKTTIKLRNLDTHLAKYFDKIITQVREKLNLEINILYNRFTGLEHDFGYYLLLGQNYFTEKIENLDINVDLQRYDDGYAILDKKLDTFNQYNILSKIKEIGKHAYNEVQEEILKELEKKKKKLNKKQENIGKTEISVFDEEDIFTSDETLELKEIDFSNIVIEDYELFTTVEEFKIAIKEYYKFYNIEISIEELDGLSTKQKQIIVKQEDGEIILDMTFDLDSNKPIEFHSHSFCEGNEEEIKVKIMNYVKANGVIDFEDMEFVLDDVLTQRQNQTINQDNYEQNRI